MEVRLQIVNTLRDRASGSTRRDVGAPWEGIQVGWALTATITHERACLIAISYTAIRPFLMPPPG